MKLHRHTVLQVIEAVHEIFTSETYADKVIQRYLKAHPKWGSRDRRFFAEAVYEMVRWWRLYWELAGLPPREYLNRENLQKPAIWKVWGVHRILRNEEVPEWDELVDLKPSEIVYSKKKLDNVAVLESFPQWIVDLLKKDFPKDFDAILQSLNQPADVYLRANTLRATAEQVIAKLATDDIYAEKVPGFPDAIRLTERRNVFTTKAFHEGLFEVQDVASQMVAPMLQLESGLRVVDACAGGGGKSLHIATLMKNKGKVLSLDIHDWKLKELRERARRNGLDIIETRHIDSTKVIKRMADSADRVLLDVPCSGMGVLRRNPDAKWKLSMAEINRLIQTQKEILASYSRMTKVGGILVYATCSLLPEENEQQVQNFLKNTPDWELIKEMHVRPDRDGFDGFYAASLRRLK